MKSILIACTALVCLLGNDSLAQLEEASLAFKNGEWFEMRIHFGIFNTASAQFSLNKTEFEGKEVFHAQALGKTTGLFRWFYKVDDDYQTFFNLDSGLPEYFIRDIYENGYTKHVHVRFDQQNRMATVHDLEKETSATFSTLSNVQDLISVFYYLRNFLPKKSLTIGESFNFNMFFDEENYVLDLKYLGRETIKTPFGKIWCLKFQPSVKVGRVFKTKNSLTLWISEDHNRIPIRLQASLSIGNIRADLEKVRNLAHPFKIIVD